MAVFNKFVRFMTAGGDNGFESYYTSLARRTQDGPNAREARRDYEVIRRVKDRAIIF